MIKEFICRLNKAEGRSEFIIAVVCDIRGFSRFSTLHESPNLAMFITRFYLKLTKDYFTTAVFVKPTGDGLLMIFRYSETNLVQVSELVINTCQKVIKDFPDMFKDDPMINFSTPANLGFGIARGTACCIFSGKRIVDYTGQLLNLAARLNDLAHPKGIVIDGAFQQRVMPEGAQSQFQQRRAFIRGISEESAHEIICSREVDLPNHALAPLISHEPIILKLDLSVDDINNIDIYRINLEKPYLTLEKMQLDFFWTNMGVPGHIKQRDYKSFNCGTDAKGSHLKVDIAIAKSIVAEEKLSPEAIVYFEFQYIPKPKGKKKNK